MSDEITLRGSQALTRLIEYRNVRTVMDVGSGAQEHAKVMRNAGLEVYTVDLKPPASYVGDFNTMPFGRRFDAIWCSHVLEHQPNPGEFLSSCRHRLHAGGILAVTVPPLKHEIVGGHLALWNAGLLLYHLILAGFDCRDARVGTYASGPGYPVYNISVLVECPWSPIQLPKLNMDNGDIDKLSKFFPIPVYQGFDGRLPDIRW